MHIAIPVWQLCTTVARAREPIRLFQVLDTPLCRLKHGLGVVNGKRFPFIHWFHRCNPQARAMAGEGAVWATVVLHDARKGCVSNVGVGLWVCGCANVCVYVSVHMCAC